MDFTAKTNLDKLMIILRGFGLIALYMVASPILLYLFSLTPLKNSTIGKNIMLIIIEIIITFLLLLLFHKVLKKDFLDFKKNYKNYLKIVIPYWIIGFVLMMFSNVIINLIISDGALAANEEANRNILNNLPIYSIFSMCIFGPICEELLFRASFKGAFKNIIIYCLFTGLIFAGMHVATGITDLNLLKHWKELLYIVPYGSVGIAFSYAYFKTNNIFSSISLHIIHNSITVFFILISFLGA